MNRGMHFPSIVLASALHVTSELEAISFVLNGALGHIWLLPMDASPKLV